MKPLFKAAAKTAAAAAVSAATAVVLTLTLSGRAGAAPATAEPPVPPRADEAPPDLSDAFALIDAWLTAQVAYDRLPSLTAGVVVGDELRWRKAWGHIDAAGKVPATTASVYSICSISKLFTSVAAMQLWEQGKLPLDADVASLVPDFAPHRSDPDSGPITVRSLLTHASGVPREAGLSYWMEPAHGFPDRAALYARLREQTTDRRANDRFAYSNLGMSILGDVVASVSGEPYGTYVHDHLLAPLGMDSTVLMPAAALPAGRMATGFSALRRDGTRAPMPLFDTRAVAGAAGYASSVEDLARFARWQLRLLDKGGKELLKVATLREMQRVQWMDPDGKLTWGLGFAVQNAGGETVVGHDGQCPGYRSALTLVPKEKLAVVTMVNAFGNLGPAGDSLYTKGMRKLVAKRMKLDTKPKEGDAKGIDLAAYTGRYAFVGESLIVPWGKGLAMLRLPAADPAAELTELKPLGGDRFRMLEEDGSDSPDVATFERSEGGKVTALILSNQRAPRIGGALP